MVPTAATPQPHQQSCPSSAIPPPPLPRPPPPPSVSAPSSSPPQRHPQQAMSAPFPPPPHRSQQQGSGLGPGGSAYPVAPQSPSPRGVPGGMPPSRNHQSSGAPYHHPLHSPAQPQRQAQHRPQLHPMQHRRSSHHQQSSHHQPMHPSQQGHHSAMEPSQQQPMRPRSHHHQQQQAQQQHKNQSGSKPNPHSSSSAAVGSHQGQGHYLPTGLNGDWQSDKDMQHRRDMIQHIVRLLKQKDKNASQEWLNKLPQMVKQLEVSLYRSAPSFQAYADTSTLKHRLQLLAMEIARKTQQSKSGQIDGSRPPEQQRQSRQPNGLHSTQHQTIQRPGSRGLSSPFMGATASPSPQIQSPRSTTLTGSLDKNQMPTQRSRSQQRGNERTQVVNVDDINPMMAGNGSSSGGTNGSDSSAPFHLGPLGDSGAGIRNTGSSSSQQANKNDPDWQLRIRHKQQRLLLLHHASKCPHESGQCTVTAHCADMKRLWKHMARCTDNNCRVPHCFSSRSILSHYRKCKDAHCPACGPVRETVKKAQMKSGAGGSSSGSRGGHPGRGMNPTSRNNGIGPNISPMNASSNMFPNTATSAVPSSSSQHSSVRAPSSSDIANNNNLPISHSASTNGMATCAPISYPGGSISSPPPPYGDGNSHQQQAVSMEHSVRERDSGNSALAGNRAAGDAQMVFGPRNGTMSNGSTSHHPAGQQNDPEWKSKIRHKQQRLLLLRHASKCPYENGQCTVTPHCASMKRLWKHISNCKDQHCKVQHCMSSRYVLSHYRRCKDARCPACGPVRETIRTKRLQTPAGSLDQTADLAPGHSVDNNEQGQNAMESDPRGQSGSLTVMDNGDLNTVPSELSSSEETQQHANKRPKTEKHDPELITPGDNVISSPFATTGQNIATSSTESSQNGIGAICQPVKNEENQQTAGETNEPVKSSVEKPEAKLATVQSQPSAVMPQKSAEDSSFSLIQSFTIEQIETHIASLNRSVQLAPSKFKIRCLEILKGLQTHNHGWVFNCPVDPVELGLPDYFDIIKRPMDLGTIQKKLDSGSYHSIDEFNNDTRLTFDNAMTYNEVGSVVHDMAKELKFKFLEDYGKFLEQLEGEEEARRKNERACSLCGCEKLLFEPPVFFCNGLNCPSKRIRRNSHFYVGGSSQYFWCNQCYNDLEEKTQIELGDMTLKKSDLKKKKNDEVHEESWVQCDKCERWIHQICGLFNTRQNKENKSEYWCPQCLLDRAREKPLEVPRTKTPSAEDLPRTKLSEWLETRVRRKVDERFETLAREKMNVPFSEAAHSLKTGGSITIRQVTSTDRKLEVRERMKRRYANKNYPDEFPFRCKCIVVFQHLDGVDVILFALYVYEHGENNPPPNQRTVYISYLDSVHFMRPRKLRTFVYHEILIAYLDYARKKGFSTAHIWACPPLKGDDYIFYAKPEDQKTPKDSRLRQWYVDMLEECQRRRIVGKVTNMYDLYFANEKIDATAVPYLEGDYFPGEAENIIKDLEEGRGLKSSGKKSKKKKNSANGSGSSSGNKSKSKSKTGRSGTRSAGLDGEMPTDQPEASTSLQKESARDPVMVKLGETIHPMKESFIVAFLNWSGAKEEDMVVPKEISEYRDKNFPENVQSNVHVPDALHSQSSVTVDIVSRKRDADGNPRLGPKSALNPPESGVKIIDDDLEELDCEFFNNRQAFLNLCRGNHYQFDELRRSKHTSMMVLWHLHNRDAPKFVQQCASCSREIYSGKRYHCSICTDFDLCEECFKNPSANRGSCTHKLEAVAVENDSNKGGKNNAGSAMTEAQRKERQRNIQLHIQLIEHASRCTSVDCESSNCAKMKSYLKHGSICKVKASGGCKICKRIWTLLRIHSQNCKADQCPIPQCNAIRERIRQLAKQQQAMDDRRRQEMNRHYRHGSDSR